MIGDDGLVHGAPVVDAAAQALVTLTEHVSGRD